MILAEKQGEYLKDTADSLKDTAESLDDTASTIRDIEKGQLIREFGSQEQVTMFDISMSPDGLTALSGSSDKTIVQWHLMNPSLDELKDWININRYVRPLTCTERELYRIEPLCE